MTRRPHVVIEEVKEEEDHKHAGKAGKHKRAAEEPAQQQPAKKQAAETPKPEQKQQKQEAKTPKQQEAKTPKQQEAKTPKQEAKTPKQEEKGTAGKAGEIKSSKKNIRRWVVRPAVEAAVMECMELCTSSPTIAIETSSCCTFSALEGQPYGAVIKAGARLTVSSIALRN